MLRWPSLRKVLSVWACVTAVAYAAYVGYLQTLPPDELVMANAFGFQAMVGAIVVGIPSVTFLFLLLLIGAIAKHWLVEPSQAGVECEREL